MIEALHLPRLKGNVEQRTCGVKTRHPTEEMARREQQSIRDRTGDKVHPYLCPFCHYWHVGRKRDLRGLEA